MSSSKSMNNLNLILGMMLSGLGLVVLLAQIYDAHMWRQHSWPLFIIFPGLLSFVVMLWRRDAANRLAIPACIVTMLGLILLYQEMFDHYESWAYAWALIIPTAVGLGQMLQGYWREQEGRFNLGLRWAAIGLSLFLMLAIFFEKGLEISQGHCHHCQDHLFRGGLLGTLFDLNLMVANLLWPLMLVGAGVYLLARGSAALAMPALKDKADVAGWKS